MEKKSLGRGLGDISNIFLSNSDKTKANPHPAEDQCQIEETMTARNKLAFQNDGNEKKSLGRGLEDISNIFLSTSDKTKANSHQPEDQCEIEETVTVRKKLAFQNNENVQQNMLRALSKHLEKGYSIRRVDLKKIEDISTPRSRVRREEEVIISIIGRSYVIEVRKGGTS